MATAKPSPAKKRGRKGNVLSGFDASVEEQSALDQYLRDVSRHELITPEKEKELGAKAQLGDQDAIQELARANLRFVISVAKKYLSHGFDPRGERWTRHSCAEVRSRAGREVHQLCGLVDSPGDSRLVG